MSFNLLSFNIWGKFGPSLKKRWTYASEEITKLGCNVLCLQECTDLQLLKNLMDITGLHLVMVDPDETGLAILTRIPTLDHGLIPYLCKSPLESYARKYMWTTLMLETTTIQIVNTHLSWKPADDATRQKQTKELLLYSIQEDKPMIFTGDFNCEYSSQPLEPFRNSSIEDTMQNFPDQNKFSWDNNNPHHRTHKTKFPNRRIDLTLTNPAFRQHFTVQQSQLCLNQPNADNLYPSDHYGINTLFHTHSC